MRSGSACKKLASASLRDPSELNRFQDPARAFQNPDSAPRPAIWNLKDKLRMSDSEFRDCTFCLRSCTSSKSAPPGVFEQLPRSLFRFSDVRSPREAGSTVPSFN